MDIISKIAVEHLENNLTHPCVLVLSDGKVAWANAAARKIGISPGRNASDFFISEDVERALSGETPLVFLKKAPFTDSSDLVPYFDSYPVYDGDRRVGIFLISPVSRMLVMFDNIGIGVFVCDNKGNIILSNSMADKLLPNWVVNSKNLFHLLAEVGQNVNSYGKEFKSDMDTHFCHSDPPLAEKNLFLDKGSFADAQDDGLNKSCGVHPFAELLRRLHGIAGLESIWFLTSNPWDFSDDLINTLALPKIEKYLHLPVQSGDAGVLKRMNRPYTAEEYKGLVKKIRKQVPGIQLGTDLIVGFPGETEEQFWHTVELVREVGFEGAYIAMYSPRPGTAAAILYKDSIPRKEKKRRHAVLTKAVGESNAYSSSE